MNGFSKEIGPTLVLIDGIIIQGEMPCTLKQFSDPFNRDKYREGENGSITE
jgi:hypothetical protein